MGGTRGWMLGESRFAIRRGEVMDSALLVDEMEPVLFWGFHPMPDSRRIDDFMGSGEFESRRSLKGDLRLVIDQWLY
jgi:hypothetical protein